MRRALALLRAERRAARAVDRRPITPGEVESFAAGGVAGVLAACAFGALAWALTSFGGRAAR